jgi:hypothetical protein
MDDVTLDLSGHYSHQQETARAAKCRVSDPTIAGLIPFGFAAGCSAAERTPSYHFATELNDHYFLDTYGTSLVGAGKPVDPGRVRVVGPKSVSAWGAESRRRLPRPDASAIRSRSS